MQLIDVEVQGIDHEVISSFNFLHTLTKNEISSGFIYSFFKDYELLQRSSNDRILSYILRRLIYIGKYVKSKGIFDSNFIHERSEIKSIILREFNIEESKVDEFTDNIIRLINEVPKNNVRGKLSKEKSHKGSLHKYALEHNLRCYICGSEVDYYNPEAKNYREFEHVVPQSLGGNKTNKNIYIACAECNRAKANFINWNETDFLTKHNVFFNMDSEDQKEIMEIIDSMENEDFEKELLIEERMADKINKDLIYIVSNMYNYKCSMCGVDNDISNKTYIIKKEENDYCHPFNLMTICDECLSQVDANWVDTNNYIRRVRISNVNN